MGSGRKVTAHGQPGTERDETDAEVEVRSPGGSSSAESATEELGSPQASDRWSRIQRRAYELAEERGFSSGAELDDWLQAEQEIDARPKATRE